jgi:hypothetical protein
MATAEQSRHYLVRPRRPQQHLGRVDRCPQVRRRLSKSLAHQAVRAVPLVDLGQPVVEGYRNPVGPVVRSQ